MVRRRQSRKLFEEVGLAGEPEINPYSLIGLTPEFIARLLEADRSGESVKKIVGTFVTKVLARQFHPDNLETGDTARFREVEDANQRIKHADTATLRRWTKTENVVSTGELQKVAAARKSMLEQVGKLVTTHMETNHHPQHVSQLQWAQGLLLRRRKTTLLLRQQQNQGIEVLRGETMQTGVGALPSDEAKGGPFDVRSFLWHNKLFGLKPHTEIAAYIDEAGRTSLLRKDLSFIMDVTDALGERRMKRQLFSKDMVKAIGSKDAWMRQSDPVIIATTVPEHPNNKPPTEVIVFPRHSSRDLAWNLSMEVAGSVADKRFFDRIKHAPNAGSLALSSGLGRTGAAYFNLTPAPPISLTEQDTGYSGLLDHGSSLLLYDRSRGMPFATDCEIMGMIGSYPQAD